MPHHANDTMGSNAEFTGTGDTVGATVVITHRVRDGRQDDHEKWMNEIGPLCRSSPSGSRSRVPTGTDHRKAAVRDRLKWVGQRPSGRIPQPTNRRTAANGQWPANCSPSAAANARRKTAIRKPLSTAAIQGDEVALGFGFSPENSLKTARHHDPATADCVPPAGQDLAIGLLARCGKTRPLV
jgi:hypothetical protein